MPFITALFDCNDKDIVNILYTIRTSCQIIDYLPKTELTSDIVGNIIVVETIANGVKAGFGASTLYRFLKIDAKILGEHQSQSSASFEKIPPKDILQDAGNYEHGHSNYFRLMPSKQHTLKGMKEFTILLRVPFNWRGELVDLDCRSKTYDRGYVYSTKEFAGQKSNDIIFCMAHDNDAEMALFWLRNSEKNLLKDNEELDTAELSRGFLNYWSVMLGFKRNGIIFPGAVHAIKLAEKRLGEISGKELQRAEELAAHFGTLPDGSKPKYHKNILKYIYGYQIGLILNDLFISDHQAVDGKITVKFPDGNLFVLSEEDLKRSDLPGAHPLLTTLVMHSMKGLTRRLSVYCERYPESIIFKNLT